MAVFRVEKSRDYTTMCNYHLRDKALSLKAKGLLSVILSLPDDWNYSINGLASICKESRDGINNTLHELERFGYLQRNRIRGIGGKFADTEYVIYEKPRPPDTPSPVTDFPYMVNPDVDAPDEAETIQLNKEKESTNIPSTKGVSKARSPCGIYKNVFLSEEELKKLIADFNDYESRIDRLSEYMATTGKYYKDHYLTILTWARRDKEKAMMQPTKKGFENYSCKEGESY